MIYQYLKTDKRKNTHLNTQNIFLKKAIQKDDKTKKILENYKNITLNAKILLKSNSSLKKEANISSFKEAYFRLLKSGVDVISSIKSMHEINQYENEINLLKELILEIRSKIEISLKIDLDNNDKSKFNKNKKTIVTFCNETLENIKTVTVNKGINNTVIIKYISILDTLIKSIEAYGTNKLNRMPIMGSKGSV